MKRILLVALCAIFMNSAFAEGYQVNLQSARQTGMGHVGTAMKLGAESMHFNPAALSFMDTKWDFSGGGALIFSKTDLTVNSFPEGSEKNGEFSTDNPTSTPFYLYGSYKINDKLAVGLSANSQYGSSVNWGENWHPDGATIVEDISLQAIYIQPTVSYKVNNKLSFGAGLMIVNGALDYNLDKSTSIPISEDTSLPLPIKLNLSGSTTNVGYNVGVFYDASEKVSLGLSYRSEVEIELTEGEAEFTKDLSALPDALKKVVEPNLPVDGTFTGMLPMPANLTFGIAYKASDKLLLSADFQHVFWSAYESLELGFPDQPVDNEPIDQTIPKEWDNSTAYRIGAEYYANDVWTLRAGFYYDSTPVNMDNYGPETPGMNKIGASLGASVQFNERFGLDVAVLYNKGLGADGTMIYDVDENGKPLTFGGEYSYSAIMPTFGVHYSF